jgi:hypothetical protein|tara:strand:- start:243 stop:653 length:411 start_codon:yes stop_codon:yes gene_type:complete
MKITQERLKQIIKEEVTKLSREGLGDDVPMMPPKPVDPEGIAGTDVPMTALSDGVEAARTAVEAMYSPNSREYARAMEVLNLVSNQEKSKSSTRSSRAPGGDDHLGYMYDFVDRSSKLAGEPQPKNPLPNPFRKNK